MKPRLYRKLTSIPNLGLELGTILPIIQNPTEDVQVQVLLNRV